MEPLTFNPAPSYIMHLDLNSCFASIEQQANPLLRGKPVVVAAYVTSKGCIIAPSVEAKKLGIKVGMRVKDGKRLCSSLVVLPPDPWKYRKVHLKLRKVVSDYTNNFSPKSIDEFVLNMEGYLSLKGGSMMEVAQKIKLRIKEEIGEWLTVSIGVGPNRFLAKLGASLHKPDGLDEINKENFWEIYSNLELADLNGIKLGNILRLNRVGIFSVLDFYKADLLTLKAAFSSVVSYYWYLRLRGWEIDGLEFQRRSFGNSFSLPIFLKKADCLSPVLSKLVAKMGARLRKAGFAARGIHLAILYRDFTFWHLGKTYSKIFFDSKDIYKEAFKLLSFSPQEKPVHTLAVSVFNLVKIRCFQLDLFENVIRKRKLAEALDKVNERWGNFVVTPARMYLGDKTWVGDRVAFGSIKELEEFTMEK